MCSPKEFREFAHECTRWADEAHSERQRQVLLDLARLWSHAALQMEKPIAFIDDGPPLAPKGDTAGRQPRFAAGAAPSPDGLRTRSGRSVSRGP